MYYLYPFIKFNLDYYIQYYAEVFMIIITDYDYKINLICNCYNFNPVQCMLRSVQVWWHAVFVWWHTVFEKAQL